MPRKSQIPFEEVEKVFGLPIAEACNILGMQIWTLKKVCRDNGFPRWPYRKLQKGMTMEQIKEEFAPQIAAAKARKAAAAAARLVRAAPPPPAPAAASQLAHILSNQASPAPPPSPMPQTLKARFSPQGFPYPYPVPLAAATQRKLRIEATRAGCAYLSDFELGFPAEGLVRTFTNRWWGTSSNSEDVTAEAASQDDASAGDLDLSQGLRPRNQDGADAMLRTEEADRSLTSLASAKGRAAHYSSCHAQLALQASLSEPLSARERAILQFVFGNHLPTQSWTALSTSS
eukprot:SM000057S18398  [mRNA]  locus=s57:466681:468294:+ [translate_table: standard]